MLLLVGFKSKTPKIIAGYNSVLNELLSIYGIRRMKYLKPYLQEVIRVIGAEKLAAVKTEGMNTLKEAYKWMSKEAVEPMLGNLK
jgi:ubiquinone/menaquinone biosynthesis C-methylase UbiE